MPQLVDRAVLAESHHDAKHANPDIQGIHRLHVPVEIGGKLYRAKLTVRDYTGEKSGNRTNLHALEAVEIETPGGAIALTSSPLDEETKSGTPAGRALSVSDLLQGSKREDGSQWERNSAPLTKANSHHDPDTGRFASGGAGNGGDKARDNARMQQEIQAVIDAAKGAGHAPQKAQIGVVSDWLAQQAQRARLDIADFTHVVDGSAVRHIFKKHGDPKTEQTRGQLAVTAQDILRLPEIAATPDRAIFGTLNRLGKEQVAFLKKMEDGSILYFEEVRAGRRELAAVTMRKYPATMNIDDIASTLHPNALGDGGNELIVVSPGDAVKPVHPAATSAPNGARLELAGDAVAPHGMTPEELRVTVTKWAKQRWSHESGGKPEVVHVADAKFDKDVVIGWQGVKHALAGANQPEMRLIPHIAGIMRSAQYLRGADDRDGRAHIKKAHFFHADVILDGEALSVGLVVHEKTDGQLFYDQFIINKGQPRKDAPPPGTSGNGMPGGFSGRSVLQPASGGRGSISAPGNGNTPLTKAIGLPPVIRIEFPEAGA